MYSMAVCAKSLGRVFRAWALQVEVEGLRVRPWDLGLKGTPVGAFHFRLWFSLGFKV